MNRRILKPGIIIVLSMLLFATQTAAKKHTKTGADDKVLYGRPSVVTRDMVFQIGEVKPIMYKEALDGPVEYQVGHLVFLKTDAGLTAPPLGVRSAVPLGGLGAGTIELRADGTFQDWQILNNWGYKPDVGLNLFAVKVQTAGDSPTVKVLSTHPPEGLPAVERIEYRGAFPMSRLAYQDPELPVDIVLEAFCSFVPRDSKNSAVPAAYFRFRLKNDSSEAVQLNLMFSYENTFGGEFSPLAVEDSTGFTVRRTGEDRDAGSVSFAFIDCEGAGTSFPSFDDLWSNFAGEDLAASEHIAKRTSGPMAGASADVSFEPGESRELVGILAWYFPNHYWGGPENPRVGHQYANWFGDSRDVLRYARANLTRVSRSMERWHRWCYENSLPMWLKDTLANSVSIFYKTSHWFENGDFRQLESFSSPSVEPIHVRVYHAVLNTVLFPDLDTQVLGAYADGQRPDGYIQELLGYVASTLKAYGSERFTDITSDYILMVYQHYLWTGDLDFLFSHWPHVKRALDYMLQTSSEWGLPSRGGNHWDIFRYDKRDVNSYVGFLHLAALRAIERMAEACGEPEVLPLVGGAFQRGQDALEKCLWTGQYYRDYWASDLPESDLIHADHLFGQLYAHVLDLGYLAPKEQIASSLDAVLRYNDADTPYGATMFMHTNPPGRDTPERAAVDQRVLQDYTPWKQMENVWCSASFTIAGEAVYLGRVQMGMKLAKEVCDNYAENQRDFWNWLACHDPDDGHPTANSHYRTVLNLWLLSWGLTGFQYDASSEHLSFAPAREVKSPFKFPFATPTSLGAYSEGEGEVKLSLVDGELKLRRLELAIKGSVSKVRVPESVRARIEQKLLLEFPEGITLSPDKPLVIRLD